MPHKKHTTFIYILIALGISSCEPKKPEIIIKNFKTKTVAENQEIWSINCEVLML